MKEKSEISKTRRIYGRLRAMISDGEIGPGSRLPSEPELAELHFVSRVTIRRALGELEREGLISRRPGAGTFVTARAAKRPIVADLSNALAHSAELSRLAELRVLDFGFVPPPPAIAEALRVPAHEQVQRCVRLRVTDGAPFSYNLTYVPAELGSTFTAADLAVEPLIDLLARAGAAFERADQTVSAVGAEGPEAEALAVAVGAPLLAVTRVIYDGRDRGVAHLKALYRPDRYALNMALVRIDSGGDRLWSSAENSLPIG